MDHNTTYITNRTLYQIELTRVFSPPHIIEDYWRER